MFLNYCTQVLVTVFDFFNIGRSWRKILQLKPQNRFKFIKIEAYKEGWQNVNASIQTCDANIIKGNTKNVAVIASGGKEITILKHGKYGRIEPDYPTLSGHKGNILDLEFVPYFDDYLATSSEDGTIKLWQIPEEINSNITEPLLTLEGHQKKVNILDFNTVSQGILASTALDRNIRVWDIQSGSEKYCVAGSQKDYATDIVWKNTGDLIGSSWKDKFYRICDPRANQIVHAFKAHDGSKPSKFSWMGNKDTFVTVGFSFGQQEREFKYWDIKKPDTPIAKHVIDKDSSIIYPFYDHNLDIIYFTGKGDSMIRYFDFKQGKFEKYGNDHRCKSAGVSYSFQSHYTLNSEQSEIAKVLQVTGNKEVNQLSIQQPKRNAGYAEELYPPTAKNFGQSADDFIAGKNATAKLYSMEPGVDNFNYSEKLNFNISSGQQQPLKPSNYQQQQTQQTQQQQQTQQTQQQQQTPIQNIQQQQTQNNAQSQQKQQAQQQQKPEEPVQEKKKDSKLVCDGDVCYIDSNANQNDKEQQDQQQQKPVGLGENSENEIQQLKQKISEQEQRIQNLEQENQSLRSQNDELKKLQEQTAQNSQDNDALKEQIREQVGNLKNLAQSMEN
ncbi:WD40-repeat-containing domain [Pseudocohnilembus persalinus]|uniref:Coronin n=1 Tax=Pseudocohnilembus persalinus TaxID=266149 RepID=A0A0V0QZN9_PSEPJ|nr:WD40-repeat-containing domain [Pseudocohnilembus persalinus]|eukprot:KRX07368.1 WD40-repeat-containing domain [Pseudocohnilembus persalinus]